MPSQVNVPLNHIPDLGTGIRDGGGALVSLCRGETSSETVNNVTNVGYQKLEIQVYRIPHIHLLALVFMHVSCLEGKGMVEGVLSAFLGNENTLWCDPC